MGYNSKNGHNQFKSSWLDSKLIKACVYDCVNIGYYPKILESKQSVSLRVDFVKYHEKLSMS